MTTSTSSPYPDSVPAALRDAAMEVRALAVDGWCRVRRPSTLAWWAWVLALAWVVGIGGDAFTTVTMMGTGMFEEANPVAAAGMGVLGVQGYTAAASALCAGLAVVSLGRPRGVYATTTVVALAVVAAAKVAVAVSNAALWVTV